MDSLLRWRSLGKAHGFDVPQRQLDGLPQPERPCAAPMLLRRMSLYMQGAASVDSVIGSSAAFAVIHGGPGWVVEHKAMVGTATRMRIYRIG